MIPIEQPNEGRDCLEPCALQGPSCRGLTGFWTALPDRGPEAQVACCSACSEALEPEDVPSKAEWFKRARTRVTYEVKWRVEF